MADDRNDRDAQADDAERRQREREMAEARDRGDEAEPVEDDAGHRLGDLDEALRTHEYPASTHELVAAYGDYEVESQDGRVSVEELLAPVDDETYDSADDVRSRIQGLLRR